MNLLRWYPVCLSVIEGQGLTQHVNVKPGSANVAVGNTSGTLSVGRKT